MFWIWAIIVLASFITTLAVYPKAKIAIDTKRATKLVASKAEQKALKEPDRPEAEKLKFKLDFSPWIAIESELPPAPDGFWWTMEYARQTPNCKYLYDYNKEFDQLDKDRAESHYGGFHRDWELEEIEDKRIKREKQAIMKSAEIRDYREFPKDNIIVLKLTDLFQSTVIAEKKINLTRAEYVQYYDRSLYANNPELKPRYRIVTETIHWAVRQQQDLLCKVTEHSKIIGAA
jgi:hypothetical protein